VWNATLKDVPDNYGFVILSLLVLIEKALDSKKEWRSNKRWKRKFK